MNFSTPNAGPAYGIAASGTQLSAKRRPAPRGTAAYPRKRAVKACQVCRARRTKCDNKKPSCSFCEQVGARCITSSEDLSPFDPASLKILERLDQIEDVLHSMQSPQVFVSTTDDIPIGSPIDLPAESRPLCISIIDVLSWPVFEGRYEAHLDIKALLRRAVPDRTFQSPSAAYASIDEQDGNTGLKLLESFLRHVHVKNPILDEVTVRQMVQHINLEGFGWDSESCLVLLIYALGSVASSFNEASSSTLINLDRANSYFYASQKRIGMLVGRGGVLEAQCFLFSGVYLMSILQPIQAWRHFVQALACCQEFDFAALSLRSDSETGLGASRGPPAEESVYWACWKSELELRQLLQLPDFTSKNHINPRLFPTPPMGTSPEDHREWYFFLAEISLRRLDTRIRDELSQTLRLAQMHAWMHSLPDIMSLKTPEADDDVLKFILRGHLMNLCEVIYWPFIDAVINKLQMAPLVREYAQRGFDCCVERIRLNKPGFTHRHHGTWLMIQSCTRSALVLLAAACASEVAGLIPATWREAVNDVIEMLRFWEHEVGDAGHRRYILEDILRSEKLITCNSN